MKYLFPLGCLLLLPSLSPAVLISDNSFEAISVPTGNGNWVAQPPSPNWTFVGSDGRSAGVAKLNSSWGFGAQDGLNYAFIQRNASISRTLSGLVVGQSYDLSCFSMIRTAGLGANDENHLRFSVGGNELGVIDPFDHTWRSYTMPSFIATSPSMSLNILGLDTAQDRSTLLDNFSLTETAPSSLNIINGNFDNIDLANQQWHYEANYLTNGGWYFGTQVGESGAGLAPAGSTWGSSADSGHNFGFIQRSGYITQTLKNLDIGKQYYVTFAQSARDSGMHRVSVLVDGQQILGPVGNSSGWARRTTSFFTATSASMTLKFQGIDTGSDRTSLIDSVQVVPEPASVTAMLLLGAGLLRRRSKRL